MYTQFFNIKKKHTLNYHKSAAKGFFLGTQERVRNSRGKRAISVRATEVLLYFTSIYYFKSQCLASLETNFSLVALSEI